MHSADADDPIQPPAINVRTIYRQHISDCFVAPAAIAGNGKHLSAQRHDEWMDKLSPALQRLQDAYRDASMPILRIAEHTEDVIEAQETYEKLAKGARTIVFFGTGGSALGGQTLAQIAGWGIPGFAMPGQSRRPRTRFYDNLDAGTLEAMLASLDLATTRFVVISKSGGTAETLTQFITTLQAVQAQGLSARIPELFLGLSEPPVTNQANGLRAVCRRFNIPVLDHHPGIGGRYSALTNVGLLPAIARGLDAHEIRAGARAVIDEMMSCNTAHDFPPAQGAAVAIALEKDAGIGIQVMMPYADQLAVFAQWYVQLWAESLGKREAGSTPIATLGPLGQHSQLQLFMDGPRDHLVTIMSVCHGKKGPRIDAELATLAGVDYLGDHFVGDLVAVQAMGVQQALIAAGRPVRSFILTKLDERTIGALMMHFMLETILAGDLLGVDPFDQPAVEEAKIIARAQLGG